MLLVRPIIASSVFVMRRRECGFLLRWLRLMLSNKDPATLGDESYFLHTTQYTECMDKPEGAAGEGLFPQKGKILAVEHGNS